MNSYLTIAGAHRYEDKQLDHVPRASESGKERYDAEA